ncbi:MAG TPA: DUF5647 family protein [Candidatus Brocadiaceae bacterium]
MNEQEVFTKNLILSTEFDRYLLDHPAFAEKIPTNAQIVFLPEHDPELCKINMENKYGNRKETAGKRATDCPCTYWLCSSSDFKAKRCKFGIRGKKLLR